MGLDIYAGTLTRYYSHNWKTVVQQWAEENGYTYPVLMDTTGEVFMQYGISAYPTTFMVDKDGNLFGYVQGQLNEDMMRSIIRQTMEGKRE